MNETIKCLMLDMDGTILDSETIYAQGYRHAADKYNVPITDEEMQSYSGQDKLTVLSRIDAHTGNPELSMKLRTARLDYFKHALETGGVQLHSHTREIIQFCKENNIKVGLVTSTWTNWAMDILNHFDMVKEFDFTVFGDETSENKPHPAPYFLALEKAGVKPSEVVVVEDSDSGIRSAISANLRVIQVEAEESPTSTYPELFEHVNNLKEAQKVIQELLRVPV
ncbi:MAG: HAD family phosphatase [Streptococcaceae bacterium]|jgi:HAD superfamily hydrolase (TIGR01509 family)|nr:HAD family phosphatase [Streptococcaceae bacterium]